MQHILISRTDAIGDVVLTLPVCGLIKKYIPDSKISFLGNSYTKEIIGASAFVDNFIDYNNWDDDEKAVTSLKNLNIDAIIHIYPKSRIALLAQKAGILQRIGTTNRFYHWIYCNKLIRLSRKNSSLHESQLNIKLLKGIGIDINPSIENIDQYYGLRKLLPLESRFSNLLSHDKFNLIIHPKSSGSSKEWSLQRYTELINLLNPERFKIFISGSEKEKHFLLEWIEEMGDKVTDITGLFSLSQFLSFINSADGLVAASTGPIHLAAASGINALGIYPNISSINARRWGPVGQKAAFIEASADDINSITADKVYEHILKWSK